MLARERQKAILTRVQQTGTVRVTELARELNVAEETIRRDLERLDEEGKLVRVHGGAMQPEDARLELPYDVRSASNLDAKIAISLAAMRHIREGAIIGLDASSTACELAQRIPDIPLTVVTNSLVIARTLAARPRVTLICTGGNLDAPSLSFVGSVAESTLDRFHIERLFFSCKGVDLQRGLSVAADEHARMKRKMLDLSAERILLADHSKFGLRSVSFFAGLHEMTRIITDWAVEPAALATLRKSGAEVETAGA